MHRSPLPPNFALGPFTSAEARAGGVPRSRLSAADINHPHHGVFRAGAPTDLLQRCEALLPVLGPDTWFSHLTAARLWGIPLPARERSDEPLHVLGAVGTAPVRRPGVVGWETRNAPLDARMLGPLPLVSPAETWTQLAVSGATSPGRSLPLEWLVAVGDYLLSGPRRVGERRPLCSLEELQTAVRARRGKRGVVLLTLALELVRAPVDSPEETFLRLGLVEAGLPEPVVHVPVATADGVRHGDLGYPDARILLEYQGDEHRVSRRRWLSDLTRIQLFQDAGWWAILVGADDLHPTCRPLAQRVRRALRARLRV
jgi:hypothetical protein